MSTSSVNSRGDTRRNSRKIATHETTGELNLVRRGSFAFSAKMIIMWVKWTLKRHRSCRRWRSPKNETGERK